MLMLPLSLLQLSLSLHAFNAAAFVIADSTDDDIYALDEPPMVASTWYAGWHAKEYPLSQVSWSKYTQMTYAFAVTTPDVNILSLEASDEAMLPQFVDAAHKNGVKASLSIGGWTGSRFFSSNVASPENRTAFVKAVVGLVTKYNLDAIDFDWEYPNHQGIGCNIISAQDTPNYLLFLQELRRDPIGAVLTLSAATSITPFVDANGLPSIDVSEFSEVLDYIAVMNYDIWGAWSATVGPNAPLDDSCAPIPAQIGSATSAIKAWTASGMPASQIVLGVPAYGHSFLVKREDAYVPGSTASLAAYPPFEKASQPGGDRWDGGGSAGGVDECGNAVGGVGGIWNYWGLKEGGYLDANGGLADGIVGGFDNCSQTAYVYNPQTEIMVSFDDPNAFAAKGRFIKEHGLRGFAMWEAGGDEGDVLVGAIRSQAGF